MTVTSDASWLTTHVRDIADYPRAGVTFRDITPLLGNAEAFRRAVDELAEPFRDRDIDRVVGVEARGFIPAAAVAYTLGAGFVPVRKAGKLPWAVAREEYELEYGRDKLEIHRDAIHPDERIFVIDDVLATGGTASATARLVTGLGGVIVGLGFLIELADLGGRDRLAGYDVADPGEDVASRRGNRRPRPALAAAPRVHHARRAGAPARRLPHVATRRLRSRRSPTPTR